LSASFAVDSVGESTTTYPFIVEGERPERGGDRYRIHRRGEPSKALPTQLGYGVLGKPGT